MSTMTSPRWISAIDRLPAQGGVIIKTSADAPAADAWKTEFLSHNADYWRHMGFVWLEEVPQEEADLELSVLLATFASFFFTRRIKKMLVIKLATIFLMCDRQRQRGENMFKKNKYML